MPRVIVDDHREQSSVDRLLLQESAVYRIQLGIFESGVRQISREVS